MYLLFDHKHRLGLPGSSPIVIQEDVQEPSGNWIRSSDSELVADGEDEGDEVVFQNVYPAFQARSASAPAEPSVSSRAGPSGSSPTTHVLVPNVEPNEE
ncbi:unnamed protein product [Linum trigynum]|uniref:Uncharacterized protein n=1 Tax=Linum trigynum TaxID=586398 RepID=A0AAV2FXM5_9ROSI